MSDDQMSDIAQASLLVGACIYVGYSLMELSLTALTRYLTP